MSGPTVPVKNAAFVLEIALVSQADTKLYQTNPTLAAGDVKVQTDDGTLANITTLPTGAASSKRVKVSLSASEMNGDNVWVQFVDAAGAQWCDFAICIQTSARGVDDLAYPATTGRSLAVNASGVVDAQVKDIDAGVVDVTAAPNLDAAISTRLATSGYTAPPAATAIADQVWDEASADHIAAGSAGLGQSRLDATVSSRAATGAEMALSNGAITAAKVATGAIDADAIATDAADKIADQVWDEAISGHVSAGSTGSKLNTLTNSSDPLESVVPGSYATGTAGSALGRIGTGQITTVSPVAQSGDITIIRGDDYSNSDSRSLEWTEASGSSWPTLTGGSVTFYLGTENNLIFSKVGSIVVATGNSKKVRVELTNTDTISLPVGRHLFSVRAIVNNRYATLVNAFCNVSASPKLS